MYFTLEDYKKIEQWLNNRGVKDTEFKNTDRLNEEDLIPVVQNEQNKNISVMNFTRFINTLTGNLINVSSVFNKYGITLEEAISTVPSESRRTGLIITFFNEDNRWVMYQYDSDSLNNWLNESYWISSCGDFNKFKGLFPNEETLNNSVQRPYPGDYAFIGESMEEAELWICEETGVWKNTYTRAHRYADLFEAVHSKDFSELEYTIDEQYCDRAEKDALGNIIHFTYITREGFSEYVLDKILETITKVTLPEGSIGLDQLNESLKQYIKSGGAVTNMADEEDLTIKGEVLKFKDKEYNFEDFSGKGRVYLRKNMVDGINVLEQYMLDKPNTIYIIQYDYCLNGATINIPENCILRFDGGSVNGGTIVLDNTKIEGEIYEIDVDEEEIQKSRSISHIVNNTTFINITFEGTYAVGQQLFHKSLKIPIWWNGDSWITQEWMSIDNINDWISSIESKVDENKYEVETIHNDVTSIREDLIETINNLNQLLNDNPTEAINNFNEIIKFLEGIEDTQSLDSIIKSLETQISHISTNIDNIIEGPINDLSNRIEEVNGNLEEALDNKVDKIEGKGLSSNDFRDDLAEKLDALPTEEQLNELLYEKANETSVNESLELKVDKVEGKQLSTEDFTTALKQKLEGLTNYNDEELSSKIDELKNALDVILDSDNTTAVIDTWQEIEDFLAGITNAETLTGLLADLKSEIVALCADTYVSKNKGIILENFNSYIAARLPQTYAVNVVGEKYLECWGSAGWWNFKAGKYIVNGGTSSQFLKANGSVDSTAYYSNNSFKCTNNIGDSSASIPFKTSDGVSVASIGAMYQDGIFNRFYLGWGTSSYLRENSFIVSSEEFAYKNYTIWHAGNDGENSGLDADLLDGKHNGELTAYRFIGERNLGTIAKSSGDNQISYYVGVSQNLEGIFPVSNNANSILSISKHQGDYYSQIGFSSNGNLYYRSFNNKVIDTTTSWKKFAFTDSNVASADKLTTKQLTNEDLNDIKDSKFSAYYAYETNTCANKPSGITAFGLIVQLWGYGGCRHIMTVNSGQIFTRSWNGQTWSSWQQIATTDGVVAKLTTKQLTNEDLNTIKSVNFSSYFAHGGNSIPNNPFVTHGFYLQVFGLNENYIAQIITDVQEAVSFKRQYINGTWSAWKKMLTEDDIASLVSRIEALEAQLNN